jgi:surfactin synthase thioesterase subunit
MSEPSRWFHLPQPRPQAPLRLFLFPHGGGAAASYARWADLVPHDVELVLIQLPGRHDRRAEQPFDALDPLVEALLDALEAEDDGRPYAFFGHSMGAMIAYRLTARLQDRAERGPILLAVSSWAPGGSRPGAADLARLPDSELAETVRGLGALPTTLLASPDMLRVLLPALRADFAVYADYCDEPAAIRCPVTAYGATDDPLLLPGAMAVWADRASTFLGAAEYPGGHFYLDTHALDVATDLSRHLRRLLPVTVHP